MAAAHRSSRRMPTSCGSHPCVRVADFSQPLYLHFFNSVTTKLKMISTLTFYKLLSPISMYGKKSKYFAIEMFSCGEHRVVAYLR